MNHNISPNDIKKPNNCDDDLLEVNTRRTNTKIEDIKVSIIKENEDYVIINKPWDVRMYGDFSLTVEKLVSRWTGITSNFKWVHRLDYATSGVLCIGKNTNFAAAASRAFERRMVRKHYLAVVQGIVTPLVYPILSHLSLNNLNVKKTNNNDSNSNNSQNNSPNSSPSVPQKRKRIGNNENESISWQDQALETGLKLHYAALQQTLTNLQNVDTLLKKEIDELGSLSYEQFKGNNKLRKRLRKVLKSLGLLETVSSEKASYESILPKIQSNQLDIELNNELDEKLDEINHDIQKQQEESGKEEEKNQEECEEEKIDDSKIKLNLIEETKISLNQLYVHRLTEDQLKYLDRIEGFKMEGNTIPSYLKGGQDGTGEISDILWINAPIQDIPGDFRMCIPEEMSKNARGCETKVKILQYGTYQGKPVTKVSLMPVSGRRHQLRLHCLAMGHPIVGDGTYGFLPEEDDSERMMLHAHEISIRLKYKKIDSEVNAQTEDPFPFDSNNELIIDKST